MAYLTYTESELKALFDFYGNKCLACGSTDKLTIDHVNPTALDGLDVLQNIQPLCLRCNARKGAKMIDYRPEPYLDAPVVDIPVNNSQIRFRLKEIAEAKEINRHQISMLTGISYPTISKYWDDEAAAYDKSILNKLCNLLKCTPGELLEFKSDIMADSMSIATSIDHIDLTAHEP